MLRIGKMAVIWSAVLLMAVEPVSACRFRAWRHCAPVYCYPNYSCYSYSVPACPPADCYTTAPAEHDARPTTPGDQDAAPAPPAPSAPAAPAPVRPQAPTDTFRPEPAPLPAPTDPAAGAPSPDPFGAPARDFPPAEPAPQLPLDEPARTPAFDDMPAEPAVPDTSVDDLFDNTTPAPATPDPLDPPTTDGVDDLFRETSEPRLPDDATPKPSEVDDLFSDPAPDKSTSLDEHDTLRQWTDNTGKFQVRARLVMVNQTHVRLLKENGRYTTVPFDRLSQADLAFVRHQGAGQIASW